LNYRERIAINGADRTPDLEPPRSTLAAAARAFGDASEGQSIAKTWETAPRSRSAPLAPQSPQNRVE